MKIYSICFGHSKLTTSGYDFANLTAIFQLDDQCAALAERALCIGYYYAFHCPIFGMTDNLIELGGPPCAKNYDCYGQEQYFLIPDGKADNYADCGDGEVQQGVLPKGCPNWGRGIFDHDEFPPFSNPFVLMAALMAKCCYGLRLFLIAITDYAVCLFYLIRVEVSL